MSTDTLSAKYQFTRPGQADAACFLAEGESEPEPDLAPPDESDFALEEEVVSDPEPEDFVEELESDDPESDEPESDDDEVESEPTVDSLRSEPEDEDGPERLSVL